MGIIIRMSLDSLLEKWRSDPETGSNFTAWQEFPARPADLQPLPDDLPGLLRSMLEHKGIHSLYSHQVEAWTRARRGENIVLATGTASGKTLAYTLPILGTLLVQPESRALLLFPTKALAQDQFSSLVSLQASFAQENTAIYDGDTTPFHRRAIRENARILLSNPDMLHTGILPHHTNWADFFSNLKYVVIDETHTYRGVFGSHVANVLRRLDRIAAFYGSHPQYLLTSATIGNPVELAEKLVGAPVHLIDRDGSSRGPRYFLLYNPPVVNESIGLRKSAIMEAVRLSSDLLQENLQQVVFTRTRRGVEILLKFLQEAAVAAGKDHSPGEIRGYRSGYLPSQRRIIEQGLRQGSVRLVVATNALELGIDIGGLEASLVVGYPGTIASTRQQAGRAGRGSDPAAAILVASSNPMDQFLVHHPEYFFGRSPEMALIAPDHLLILLNHLRCAMFELPFRQGEIFGGQPVDEFLDFLVSNQESHLSSERYYWMADSYPAANISLRSASPGSYVLQAETGSTPGMRTVGIVDAESALWMVHPGAVYLHEGQPYLVESLDLEQKIARLQPFEGDYLTESIQHTSIEVLSINQQDSPQVASHATHSRSWGEVKVTTQVVGFLRMRWLSRENLGEHPLDLPPTDLQTTGYWLSIAPETVERLGREGLWTNFPNEYGPSWNQLRDSVRKRDDYRCQVCGQPETSRQHEVHHKVPFRLFRDESGHPLRDKANQPGNLVTLCANCHKQVEQNIRVRSGLSGLAYALGNLAPLFLMCDPSDLGNHVEPVRSEAFPDPSVVLYDLVPAGIGFSQKLYEMHTNLLARAHELVQNCPCESGCPSCVGPGGENGQGGKLEALALMKLLVG